jgi:hypothetical protein
MDFVIEKKAFDSAMKQVLFGRSGASEDLIDLRVERSMLTLVAMGTNVEVPVTSDASESVSITVDDLVKLKKVSATYKAGPVRIRIGDGRIRFQNTSIGVSASQTTSVRRVIDIPNDASTLDLVSLPAIFSLQEIEHCGLQARVQKAKETIAGMLRSAVSSMGEFGFTHAEVTAMAEVKLKSHAATMRRVLFPDENPSEGDVEQDTGSNPNNFEGETPDRTEMSKTEMKAELERLRAENAQLKTKEKGGINLKVSDKGAVSLYGMGRFPVTLYKESGFASLPARQIEAFIQENVAKLKTKE